MPKKTTDEIGYDLDDVFEEPPSSDVASYDQISQPRFWSRLRDWFFKPSDAQQNQATDTDTDYQTSNEDKLYFILNGQ